MVEPAFKGTLSVLRAANQFGVKRVVICSSFAAIVYREPENYKELYTEEDWSDLSVCQPYMKSKNLAEKAAWDYLHSLPDSTSRFELIVLNPSICLGPTLTGRDFASGLSIKKIMSGKIPGTGKFMLALVDVRDAAESHLRAILAPAPM